MKKIYASGPMDGCTKEEKHGWRDFVTYELRGIYEILDPTRRSYEGKNLNDPRVYKELVEKDKEDMVLADIFLTNPWKPSTGTPMETMWAFDYNKPNIVICPKNWVSPWYTYHATKMVNSVEEAIEHLITLYNQANRALNVH